MKTNLQRVFKVSAVIKHAWVGYTWSRLNRHVSLVQRMSAVSRCSAIVLFNAANALYAVCALQKNAGDEDDDDDDDDVTTVSYAVTM